MSNEYLVVVLRLLRKTGAQCSVCRLESGFSHNDYQSRAAREVRTGPLRFSLSASHPLACVSRPVHLLEAAARLEFSTEAAIHSAETATDSESSSVAPKRVTAMMAEKISSMPAHCRKDGVSESSKTPQTMVRIGCKSTANEV